MEPRLNVITLAVDDLERALGFHRDGLGLQTECSETTPEEARLDLRQPLSSSWYVGLYAMLPE